MNSFFSILEQRAKSINSLLCVGLDPHRDLIEEYNQKSVYDFCSRIIESTLDFALAFKPNIAFFEALGTEGLETLKQIIKNIPKDIPVILDAKRGDIADTSRSYAEAVFKIYNANAVTVNSYLGEDAIQPFISDPMRGAFVLCKTSNPSADEIQSICTSAGLYLYEQVAINVQRWNRNNNVGLVVGATDVKALSRIRALVPQMWFLVPGIGAQGGDLEKALSAGLRQDGLGMLIAVSRSLAKAKNIREEAKKMVELIRSQSLKVLKSQSFDNQSAIHNSQSIIEIADLLIESNCVKFGQFTLKSGKQSPIYFDLRRLVSYPQILSRIASSYLAILKNLSFDRIAGLPYSALPIGTAISIQGNYPMIYPRLEAKSYGTKAEIEGDFTKGERIVIIDDVATTGGAKIEALSKLRNAGLIVNDVVVLVDRESGADKILKENNVKLHSVVKISQLLSIWQKQGKITEKQVNEVIESLI